MSDTLKLFAFAVMIFAFATVTGLLLGGVLMGAM